MTATSIEWTDRVWNPVRGCSRTSPGCEHCYAEAIAERFSGPGQAFDGFAVRGKGWTRRVELLPAKLDEPRGWREPARVFVNSTSDLFHDELTNEQIAAVFNEMSAAPRHTFQVLTKRSARMREWFEWLAQRMAAARERYRNECEAGLAAEALISAAVTVKGVRDTPNELPQAWPLPNVWIGVSVEDQTRAQLRIPNLLAVPAAVRFVSVEPLLEAVDLSRWMWPVHESWPSGHASPETARAAGALVTRERQALVHADRRFLDWVIVGGESGPGARPFEIEWARAIVAQCKAAGVACFVKQLGDVPVMNEAAWRDHEMQGPSPPRLDLLLSASRSKRARTPDGKVALHMAAPKVGEPLQWPADLRVREYPR